MADSNDLLPPGGTQNIPPVQRLWKAVSSNDRGTGCAARWVGA
jgi:hypothetical protein